ncbi:uncharacterized protein LOC125563149 isoform X2 [Nematostella vectensis]|uniref:uncharacterized protein LOC125563149 isoform X2 n=1 Tax=Nematostella vectensis TaxID=45351 RepID=UPI0020774605|nr:uncharacterized protein LOC125563149 isoform X2 [Nematostella vectensis]
MMFVKLKFSDMMRDEERETEPGKTVILELMSSEESDSEERYRVRRSMEVCNFFSELDRRRGQLQTPQQKRQTNRRVVGDSSDRTSEAVPDELREVAVSEDKKVESLN